MYKIILSLVQADFNGDNIAEGLGEFVDGGGVRLPILLPVQFVAVNHQVKEWYVAVSVFIEVFLDI